MFFSWRLARNVSIFAFAITWAIALSAPGAIARPRGELVLATSAEDAVLTGRIVALSPSVNPEEARRVAFTAYTTGRELAQKWQVTSSPTWHNFLINIGARKYGYCFHWATELLSRLDALKLQTLELHWAEADLRTDTEHNVIVVTARGQPMEAGILLDNWRRAGRLLWGPVKGDPSYAWKENKNELWSRLKRKPSTPDQPRRKTRPKNKLESR